MLEIYYNQAKNWLKQCSGTSVMLWAVVGATEVTSLPQVIHMTNWCASGTPHGHRQSCNRPDHFVLYPRLKRFTRVICRGLLLVWTENAAHGIIVATLHWLLTQGPKDGVIIFKNSMGAILGEGPVQAVSVGHVGFSVTLDAKSAAVGLVQGTNTGALSRTTPMHVLAIHRHGHTLSDNTSSRAA